MRIGHYFGAFSRDRYIVPANHDPCIAREAPQIALELRDASYVVTTRAYCSRTSGARSTSRPPSPSRVGVSGRGDSRLNA